ncbi:MAG TPA: hypothetical protein GX016_09865 [Firmicutes bacterium]|nr:hypothetical protein [Bacillota bacterium]
MSQPIIIKSVYELMDWLKNEKIEYQIVGETAMGHPIVMVHKEGVGQPVIITAGAHASEPAGVSAALELLKNWDYPFPLYMFPLRDPFGCQGYAGCLSQILGQEVEFKTCEELNELLLKHADKVYNNDGKFTIVLIKDVLFTNLRFVPGEAGPRQSEICTNEFLQAHPEFIAEFEGKRIVCPANFTDDAETVRQYERAFTAEITSNGTFADMNRRFGGESEPPEVKIVREKVDEIKPYVALDLHEGFGSTYYYFVTDYTTNERLRHYVDLMIDACKDDFPSGPWRLQGVVASIPEAEHQYIEPVPGVLQDIRGKYSEGTHKGLTGTGFSGYCSRYCPSVTLESGTDNTMKARVRMHVKCATAVLEDVAKTNKQGN